jgi:hypothetical protein
MHHGDTKQRGQKSLSSAKFKNQSNIKMTNKLFIRGIEKSKLRTNKLASQNLDLKALVVVQRQVLFCLDSAWDTRVCLTRPRAMLHARAWGWSIGVVSQGLSSRGTVSGNGSGAAAGSGREDGERRRGTENLLGLAASNSSYILRY